MGDGALDQETLNLPEEWVYCCMEQGANGNIHQSSPRPNLTTSEGGVNLQNTTASDDARDQETMER